VLALPRNRVREAGALALALAAERHAPHLPALRCIDLSGNAIGAAGVAAAFHCLAARVRPAWTLHDCSPEVPAGAFFEWGAPDKQYDLDLAQPHARLVAAALAAVAHARFAGQECWVCPELDGAPLAQPGPDWEPPCEGTLSLEFRLPRRPLPARFVNASPLHGTVSIPPPALLPDPPLPPPKSPNAVPPPAALTPRGLGA
jgi:hypothetical protein